jgi:hypothetical protein
MNLYTRLLSSFLVLFLASLPEGASTPSVRIQNSNSPSDISFQNLWLNTTNNSTELNLVIAGSGVLHAGYTAYSPVSGKWPAYYATCSSACNLTASWTTAIVGDVGAFGGEVRVAVNASGSPRLMWYNQASAGANGAYYYAECSSACANASNWTSVKVLTTTLSPESSAYFALNFSGHPRFVYKDIITGDSSHNHLYYEYCSSSCTTAANWARVEVSALYEPLDFSLALDSSGGAHLAFRDATVIPNRLVYAECAANCTTSSANWSSTELVNPIGSLNTFSLALDPQGHPRLALYMGYLGSGNTHNNLLTYLWCSATCSNSSNWVGYYMGLPADYGIDVNLAFDAQGLPHLAYYIDSSADSTYGLGYAACTSACESLSAAWHTQLVETTVDLEANDPVPVASGCSLSTWLEVGTYPSLVLDSSGSPDIGYTAAHYQGGSCSIHVDINLVRMAVTGTGINPGQKHVYLPFIKK